jgi:hypothetical protein
MKNPAVLWVAIILSLILVLGLFVRVLSLDKQVQSLSQSSGSAVAALEDALKRTQTDVATTKDLAPGLGEYMTTIQLHAGKLWFAAKALNWESRHMSSMS